MKKAKLILMVCAALAAVVISTKPAKAFFGPAAWFQYMGGGETNINNYQKIQFQMGCSGSGQLCDIFVATGTISTMPDPSAFNALASESSNFTVAGTFAHGQVEIRSN